MIFARHSNCGLIVVKLKYRAKWRHLIILLATAMLAIITGSGPITPSETLLAADGWLSSQEHVGILYQLG